MRRLGQVRLQEARYLAMEIKWPGASLHSRPAPFQQRTNTSCYLAIPTRGFTAAVSVFRGTPPTKPLICKIWFCKICFALPGDPIDLLQAPRRQRVKARLRQISFCARGHHPDVALFLFTDGLSFVNRHSFQPAAGKNKKPCLHSGKQGEKTFFDSLPAYPNSIQIAFGPLPAIWRG